MGYNANLQANLDELYFRLPIAWGDQRRLAAEFDVHEQTILKWLKRLEAEGLALHVGLGRWEKCYRWAL